MKKLMIATLSAYALTGSYVIADDCSSGGCGDSTTDVPQQGNMTDVNSPNFYSNPTSVMQGSNTNINNVMDNVSRIGDVQCGNTSWNVGAYNGKQHTNNIQDGIGVRGHNYGVNAGLSGSFGDADSTCLKALDSSYLMIGYQAEILRYNALDKKVSVCITMVQNGVVMSDQIKKQYPALAMCDHFRIMKKEQPKQFTEAQRQLMLANNTKKVVAKPKKKSIVSYQEYRLKLGVFKINCQSVCLKAYDNLRKRLLEGKVKDQNGVIVEKQLFRYEDNLAGYYSLNVRNNYLTLSEARIAQQQLSVQGFRSKVEGLKGTEVWR